MARGRVIDSDAFGSGLSGGCGRGHSTCGRGGTIPPLFSSSMFGASSSAQPPVLPSLPSIPSSFTPLPRPAESSLASQSPTAPEAFHMGRGYYGYAKSGLGEIVRFTAGSEAESRIDKLALYLEAVGGKKKRKVYGIGSQASQFYCGSASDASTTSSRPQPNHSAEEISALRAHVDEQERQLVELRAHVIRIFGQHGAGTSSSDPLPATDRDVSIALHQPLSSPFDPNTANDTLVTPTDATTHPTDTPADATMLDRAEERPRRFDFGHF
ncbi:hypothetical protein JCGZ_20127 [Jatropha curcas]|uniref:Uncharacterized protein n=1 Tax=Jatropha curcas TaxID=180498 RepID=A0A067JU22_JATCU|nr:hypothetical protein JCGZ_20127 [Jatropha curcas]